MLHSAKITHRKLLFQLILTVKGPPQKAHGLSSCTVAASPTTSNTSATCIADHSSALYFLVMVTPIPATSRHSLLVASELVPTRLSLSDSKYVWLLRVLLHLCHSSRLPSRLFLCTVKCPQFGQQLGLIKVKSAVTPKLVNFLFWNPIF